MATKKKSSKKKSGLFGGTLGIVLIIAAAIIYFLLNPDVLSGEKAPDVNINVDGEVLVHVIDIGQGDAILITTPDGNMLIDAGPGKSEKALKAYLDNLGIKEFEYAIFTHPDEDHIGNADMVMDTYKVKNVILPNRENTSKAYERMITSIENSDANVIPPVSGEYFTIGDFYFRIIAPNSETFHNNNDASVVIRATYGTVNMMFTGDAEGNLEGVSEKEILAKYSPSDLQSDFLKIGHHGSTTSTSPAFLAAVNPKLAAISVGEGNDYGHPHKETIQALEKAKIPYYRTDRSGDLLFRCDGTTIEYQEKK